MGLGNWIRRKRLERKLQRGVTKLSVDDADQEDLRQILACYRQVESRFERIVSKAIIKLDSLNYSIFVDAYFIPGSERDYQYFLSVLHSIQISLEEIKKEEDMLRRFSEILTDVLARRRKAGKPTILERQTLDRRGDLIKYFRSLGEELERLISLVISIGEGNTADDVSLAGLIYKIRQNRDLFDPADRLWIDTRLKGDRYDYGNINKYGLRALRDEIKFSDIMFKFYKNRIAAPLFENSRNVRTQLQSLKSKLEKLRDNFQFLKATVHKLLVVA